MLILFMLSVANKLNMRSVVMLDVIMLSVQGPIHSIHRSNKLAFLLCYLH
jgi:hypothetical protein